MLQKLSQDQVLICSNLISTSLLVLIDIISCVKEFLKLLYSGIKLDLLTIVGSRHPVQLDTLVFKPIIDCIHTIVI